jgi:uncharacterized membrane protein YfcA
MEEWIKLLISVFVLILGIPIGNVLRKFTKEEMEQGRKWFKYLTFITLIGGFIGLIVGSDWIMFSCFFVAIVTSRSLIVKNEHRKNF